MFKKVIKRLFFNLEFNGVVLSMIDDVPVNSEIFVLTSSISRICQLIFENARRVRIYVRVHRDMCVRVMSV